MQRLGGVLFCPYPLVPMKVILTPQKSISSTRLRSGISIFNSVRVQRTVKQKRLCIYRAEALFPRYYRMKELTVATRPENTMETVEQSLMRMFREGPEVSLKGSPTVSPMTAALWQSEPLPS